MQARASGNLLVVIAFGNRKDDVHAPRQPFGAGLASQQLLQDTFLPLAQFDLGGVGSGHRAAPYMPVTPPHRNANRRRNSASMY
jgi:hypothetical protein